MHTKPTTHCCKSKNVAPGGADTSVPALGEDDKKRWIHVEGIPVFDAHDGADEDLPIKFTPDVLKKIVEQNNARIRDTGDLIPVTKGHTGGPEEPEVLGWANNFRMGSIGRDNRAAIVCDMRFTREKYTAVESLSAGVKFPRRSIELWDDYAIDPIALTDRPILDTIALLGADRPARNLGLGQKTVTKKYRYALTEDKGMNPEDVKQVVEAITSLPEWQYLKECMAGKTQLAEEEEEKTFAEEGDKKCMEDEEAKVEMADEEEEDKDVEPAKLRLQRDQLKRQFAKQAREYQAKEDGLKSELKTLFAKVSELERKERVAQRKADLMQIEAEGYSFDMSEELETVSDMDKSQFQKHVARIKKNYRKAPVNVNVKPAAAPAEGGSPVAATNPREVMAQAALKAAAKYSKEKN